MGMTITEKIIAAHSGRAEVKPGQFVLSQTDLALANDITAPPAIKAFREAGGKKVHGPSRVVFVLDHFVPARDERAAESCRTVRSFAREQGIALFETADGGIEHVILPEKGLVTSGDLVVGADSHTCTYGGLGAFATGVGSTDFAGALLTGKVWLRVPETVRFVLHGQLRPWVYGKDIILTIIGGHSPDDLLYRALDFSGPAVAGLSMADRFTICNMAVEAGAKNAVFEPDTVTGHYIEGRRRHWPVIYRNDPDAVFSAVKEYDCSDIEPLVAMPHLPGNITPARKARKVKLDQVVIGSCTNGWLEDLRIAASVLRGRKASPSVRLLVFPGSQTIYREAVAEGLAETIMAAGGTICPPSCGPCLGGHLGVLAAGERCLATTNRNFIGRMGHPSSEVYLSNPAVAAASAVLGRIGTPDDL
jgi:3-isopropylmalate/(R)-2-methylmalate dehydratase large subunit